MTIIAIDDMPSKDKIVDCSTDNLNYLYKICLEMQSLCISKEGVGLAATQVGIPFRLFVARQGNESKFRYFVNCDYTPVDSDFILSVEGCLSLRNTDGEIRRFKVNRYRQICILGQELLAEEKLKLVDLQETYEGNQSIIYQHECDHGRGVLISDIGQEVFLW